MFNTTQKYAYYKRCVGQNEACRIAKRRNTKKGIQNNAFLFGVMNTFAYLCSV